MAQLKINHGMPTLKLSRSSHNLSFKTLFDVEQNWLIPTASYDCVPGDKFVLGSSALIRTTPLVKPAFTIDLKAKAISAFVAYRTIWKPFEDFFSGGRTGNKKVPLPTIGLSTGANVCSTGYSLFDYFDLPTYESNAHQSNRSWDIVNAFYFLAYLKIWNDYFRNPSIDIEVDVFNLTIYKPNNDTPYTFTPTNITFVYNGTSYLCHDVTYFVSWCLSFINNTIPLSTEIVTTGTPPNVTFDKLFKPALVNLPRDLFTSALPTASGPNEVSLSLQGSFDTNLFNTTSSQNLNVLWLNNSSATQGVALSQTSGSRNVMGKPFTSSQFVNDLSGSKSSALTGVSNSNSNSLIAGLTGLQLNQMVSSSGLNLSGIYPRELRLVFGLDLKNQIRNLTGNRYQDLTKAFYGVDIQDYRINKAEYIGGTSYPIYTSEVLQTSQSDQTPLGDQAGHQIASGIGNHGTYFVRELGCILNLFWINSSSVYGQSLRRDWRKFSINDFFFPMFEKLGDQEILQEELTYMFDQDKSALPNYKIFGFTPRYSEYKFYNHTVKGGFRGNYKYWSQYRQFKQLDGTNIVQPTLSPSFIKPDITNFNKIYQTIDAQYTLKPYQVKFENRTIAYRPMVENTIGYLIDHF